MLGNDAIQSSCPPLDTTIQFWEKLWGTCCVHDSSTLPNLNEVLSTSQIPIMKDPVISSELFTYAVSRIKNWKSPGLDCLHGYWIKRFTSVHQRLLCYFNHLITTEGNGIDTWLLKGKTTLIMKNKQIGPVPSNYRPITCLPTFWKLLSFIVSELLYLHLDSNKLFPMEQKGCRQRSRGTKDHLLVDRMIMENARRRCKNLFMAWIDYKKAYDSVPHSWILRCLELYKVHPKLCSFISNVMQYWKVSLYCTDQYYGEINILRGIYQGDSLSPLLFVLALMPLSGILNSTNKGFLLEKNGLKLNHLLYLDDLKLFAKSKDELECLLNVVKLFSSSICMTFGLNKCATASVVRGKLVESNDVSLDVDVTIPALDVLDSYKYLGLFENEVIKDSKIKLLVTSNYKKRVRKILKSALNGRNVIIAINTWAIPLIRYTAGIVKWTQAEIKALDVSTRKLMTLHKCFSINDDIHRLYVPRTQGGRGLLSVEDVIAQEKVALGRYLESSTEPWLLKVFACGNFDCGESPSDYKNKRIQENITTLKSKPLHGQFLRDISDAVDYRFQWSWLFHSNFTKELEGFVMACQDQAISTNSIKVRIFHQAGSASCRLCGSADETVDHVLTSCSVIAQSYYKKRHDAVARIIHWELARKAGLECTTKYWDHCPPSVIQNDSMKLLWDFTVQTDRYLPHNRPDIICVDFTKKHAFLIDIAIPGDSRLSQKINEKYQRYTDLKIEVQKMWSMTASIVPVILGSLGSVPSSLKNSLQQLDIYYTNLIPKLQKSVLLSSSHILRHFVTEHKYQS